MFELAIVTTDALASRALVGHVSAATFMRATFLAYSCCVFLPAGRVSGEAARAAALSVDVGGAQAAGAGARLQACVLLANAAMSLVIAVVVLALVPGAGPLAPLLAGNALLCGALGGALALMIRDGRAGRWIRHRFGKFLGDKGAPDSHPPPPRGSARAFVLSFFGRSIQAAQYGLCVFAVGGALGFIPSLTAQGIHLVGASGGDLVPNQAGAMEGVYRGFAGALGFESAPARALSIALFMRVAQIGLALVLLALATLIPRRKAR